MSAVVVIGGLALGSFALALIAGNADAESRSFWLIQGKKYYITHQLLGPGWDVTMYPGFCRFSEPAFSGSNTKADPMVATFTADWCAPNRQFDVPDNMAIVEVVG